MNWSLAGLGKVFSASVQSDPSVDEILVVIAARVDVPIFGQQASGYSEHLLNARLHDRLLRVRRRPTKLTEDANSALSKRFSVPTTDLCDGDHRDWGLVVENRLTREAEAICRGQPSFELDELGRLGVRHLQAMTAIDRSWCLICVHESFRVAPGSSGAVQAPSLNDATAPE
jgi:hypothetical protein